MEGYDGMMLRHEDWSGFANIKNALNAAPIQKIAEMEAERMKSGADSIGGLYQAEFEKVPEKVVNAACEYWARENLQALNNVFQWLKEQIREEKIGLLPPEERPEIHFDSQGRRIDCQTGDNPRPDT